MVQDAVSDDAGVIRFPAWGPVLGGNVGLDSPRDPIVSLFKAGYQALEIDNNLGDVPETPTARQRRFGQDGATFALERFRGGADEWAEELQKVAFPHGPAGDHTLRAFRDPYLRRARLVWTEIDAVPQRSRRQAELHSSLYSLLLRLEKAKR
jgi:hypothetical protein